MTKLFMQNLADKVFRFHKAKTFVSCLMMMMATLSINAQMVSGTITSEKDGSPLIGASVLEKGTENGTITDVDGNFSLKLTKTPAVLEVSYIGFTSQDINVTGTESGMTIALTEGTALDEVVVTAFGMNRAKKALPFSVTQLGGEKFQEVRTANVGNALTGKIAGVSVAPPASGAAGSTRVVIRGGSNLGGNDQPLYVINGVPMESGNFGQAGLWGGNDGGDGLASINPDDIENISVLKGNTAAALYGAKAANGVILITTKTGKARKGMGIQFNSNITTDKAIDRTDFQNQYGQGLDGKKPTSQMDALDNSSLAWGAKFDGSQVVQFDGVQRPYTHLGETINDFYRTGATYNNSLAFSGGNETGTYRLALSDLSNSDIMPNASFRRHTANLNINSQLKKLTLNMTAQYTFQNAKNRPRLSDSPGNANFTVTTKAGNIPYSVIKGETDKLGALPDGTELRYQGNTFATNPYWAANQFYRSDITNRLLGNASARYDLTDWLYVMGRVGTDLTSRDAASSEAYGTAYKPRGDYNESFQNIRQDNFDIFVGGEKKFGEISVDYLAGGTKSRTYNETKGGGGNNLVVPFIHSVRNVEAPTFSYGYSALGTNSIFGSANIGYKSWLYLNVTGRQDQFSTLPKENNTLFYPSAGVSAILSEAVKLPSVFSFAKVRASWAQVGGGAPNPYALGLTYNLVGTGHNGANLAQIAQGSIPNQGLKPYTSTEIEIGADMRFLDNRFGVDIAYYSRKTTDDILAAGISATSGFGSTLVNIGELSNKGIELLLTAGIIRNKDFTWDVSLNFANNISEAINLGQNAKGENIQLINLEESRVRQGERVRNIVGQPLGTLVGWKHRTNAQGVKMYDENGYPLRSTSVEILGTGIHPTSAGLSNSFSYKGINLSFLIDMRAGGKIFSGTNWLAYRWGLHQETLEGRDGTLKVSGVLADGTTPINVTIPADRVDNYWSRFSDITENLTYDASYGKLREFSIGYTIPSSVLSKTPFENLTLSIVGRNLALLWSNVPNIDPESAYNSSGAAQGLEFFAMPLTRNFGINLQANF